MEARTAAPSLPPGKQEVGEEKMPTRETLVTATTTTPKQPTPAGDKSLATGVVNRAETTAERSSATERLVGSHGRAPDR